VTLAIEDAQVEYTSNGFSTGPFSTVAPYFSKSQIKVYYVDSLDVEVLRSEGTDYNISPASGASGNHVVGNVTLVIVPPNGDKIRIKRIVPLRQELDLSVSGRFDPEDIERAKDRIYMILQQLNAGLSSGGSLLHGDLPGGTLHALAIPGSPGVPGFISGPLLQDLITHLSPGGNPHGTTPADMGAAEEIHIHDAVTTSDSGFMTPSMLERLNGIPENANPLNVILFEDFLGPNLDTSTWSRTTTGTAPTGSVATGAIGEYGVRKELTAAAIPSAALTHTSPLASAMRDPIWEGRFAIGNDGPDATGINVRLGLASDPATLTSNYAMFHWTGTALFAKSRAGAGEQSTPVASITNPTNMLVYRIEVTSSAVKFYVGGIEVASHNTVPTLTEPLRVFDQIENTGAAPRSLHKDYHLLVLESARSY
jgi:hypothetical protein